jgi:hypothetical protein
VNEILKPGEYFVPFDIRSEPSWMSTGMYFYRLSTGNLIQQKSMLLLK